MVNAPPLDAPRIYNCWFTSEDLVPFQQLLAKLGIITIVDQRQADESRGKLNVGDVLAVWPNVWDEIGRSLDPASGTVEQGGGKKDQTPIRKGGGDAHYVNIRTTVDIQAALTRLAETDPAVAQIVARLADFFFVDHGEIADDPTPKRVIL